MALMVSLTLAYSLWQGPPSVDYSRDTSATQANATCAGVTYDQGSRQMTLSLGGQEFLQGK